MHQNLHIDVLQAMAHSYSSQLDRGEITPSEFNQQTTPIIAEISARLRQIIDDHERRVKTMETNLLNEVEVLRREQLETYQSHDLVIEIHDAFLESKGQADEFEEFEHQWMLNRQRE